MLNSGDLVIEDGELVEYDRFCHAEHKANQNMTTPFPDAATQAIARMVLRSWDGVAGVVPLIIDTEAEALAVLGQPERCFSDLLQSA